MEKKSKKSKELLAYEKAVRGGRMDEIVEAHRRLSPADKKKLANKTITIKN